MGAISGSCGRPRRILCPRRRPSQSAGLRRSNACQAAAAFTRYDTRAGHFRLVHRVQQETRHEAGPRQLDVIQHQQTDAMVRPVQNKDDVRQSVSISADCSSARRRRRRSSNPHFAVLDNAAVPILFPRKVFGGTRREVWRIDEALSAVVGVLGARLIIFSSGSCTTTVLCAIVRM